VRALARRHLSSNEITRLFEAWCYGRVSFTLGILSKAVELEPQNFVAQFTGALAELQESSSADRDPRMLLTVRGWTAFDGVIEVAFRYGRSFDFLDLDERTQQAAQTVFGFMWLDAREQFVAVTGDQKIVDLVFSALSSVVGRPVTVAFDRNVVDSTFEFNDLYSLAQEDVVSGYTVKTSGPRIGDDDRMRNEVTARDGATVRSDARFIRRTPDGANIKIALAIAAGRLRLSKQLSVQVMRAWVLPLVREIARGQRQLMKDRPLRFYQASTALELPGVPHASAPSVRDLAPALAECRVRDRQLVPLERGAAHLWRRLPQKAGRLELRVMCEPCDAIVPAMCSECGIDTAQLIGARVCCGTAAAHATFQCDSGHSVATKDLLDGITFIPAMPLLEWISGALLEMGHPSLDPTKEGFFVRDRTFHYQRRSALEPGRYSLLVIDIVGSTSMRRRSEEEYQRYRVALQRSARRWALAEQGSMTSDRGDGAGALFRSPIRALNAARSIARDMASLRQSGVRLGIATGTVSSNADGADGLLFNRAERLQTVAVGGIAVDGATLMGLPPTERERAGAAGKLGSLKGFESGHTESFYLLSYTSAEAGIREQIDERSERG
jgi:hypothetical protein